MTFRTGTPSWPMPELGTSPTSQVTYLYDVMLTSEELPLTIYSLLLLNDELMSIGEQLALGSLELPGKKQVSMLTLRTLKPSSGVGIEIINTSLSTNFELQYTFPTSFAGSTVIRSLWKSKAGRSYWQQNESGSLPTKTREEIGTPISTKSQEMPYSED